MHPPCKQGSKACVGLALSQSTYRIRSPACRMNECCLPRVWPQAWMAYIRALVVLLAGGHSSPDLSCGRLINHALFTLASYCPLTRVVQNSRNRIVGQLSLETRWETISTGVWDPVRVSAPASSAKIRFRATSARELTGQCERDISSELVTSQPMAGAQTGDKQLIYLDPAA